MPKKFFAQKLETYGSTQKSGKVNQRFIPKLKEDHYFIVNIPLDGDAPKQYIKAYFYFKNCPRKSKPNSWPGYFAKSGGKSYPHESVIEYTINKIGEYLGLNMNETKLVMANGQIRFLSKDFIDQSKKQRLIHGIDILAEYFEDKDFVHHINKDRKNRRKYFTFQEVEQAIIHVYPSEANELIINLVKLLTFDAIVGNNDRHFYNWGVIGNYIVREGEAVKFAPIYDSARALMWNFTEEKIDYVYTHFLSGDQFLDQYIL
ncbi:MAG: HipA domain-containing protein, partial [Bacteroidota bacterium]